MPVVIQWTCDDAECDTWAVQGELTEDWVVVHPGADQETQVFCQGWHAVRTLAKWAEPGVEIDMPDL